MKLATIIVTFNRLEKLKKTLSLYESIVYDSDYVIVVNNHSTDDTSSFLKEWKTIGNLDKKIVLELEDNLGGAGGFYYGCKKALELPVDWLLLADDDAYPDNNLFEKFYMYAKGHDLNSISAICSSVYKVDGTIDIGHRKQLTYVYGLRPSITSITEEEYKNEIFKLDLFSYVGVFLKVSALKKVGLCNPDLFIYYDDMEHSMRINSSGDIICIPTIKYIHDDGLRQAKANNNVLMSWRDYYDIRNKIYILIQHKPFAGVFWALSRFCMCFYEYPKNLKCQKLYLSAILDGLVGHLGKHKLYKPGFSIIK